MPRVAWWKGHVQGEDYKLPIFYTTTKGKFRMETPPLFHSPPFDTPTIYGDTEESLRDAMQELINKLVEFQETRQKVIAYKFRASCIIYEKYDEFGGGIDHASYVKGWGGYGHLGDGTTLQLDYEILWEYTSPIRKEPYYRKESRFFGKVSLDHALWPGKEYKRMVWTPEAEAFFKEFEDMLRNAVKKIDEFLGDDADALQLEIQRLAGRGLPFLKKVVLNSYNEIWRLKEDHYFFGGEELVWLGILARRSVERRTCVICGKYILEELFRCALWGGIYCEECKGNSVNLCMRCEKMSMKPS